MNDKTVTVLWEDLKNLLDVYIDNGMVEAEDEAAINRMGEALKQAS